MRAEHSTITSPDQVAIFRKTIPWLRDVTIAGAGHMVTGDVNDAYADAVLEFAAHFPTLMWSFAADVRPVDPHALEDVTAEWLTEALSHRYPGTLVTSAVPGTSVRATGTKLRLLLDYNDAGHAHRLPPTMWLKSGLEGHSDHVRTSHARESLFYSDIQPLGLINAPTAYFAETDRDGYSAPVDRRLAARNARFGSATAPVSIDIARDIGDAGAPSRALVAIAGA